MVSPRIQTFPASADAAVGLAAVKFARRHKLNLDPEQEFVLAKSLLTRPDGRWAPFEVGINCPRQNGKGEILIARELFGTFELKERSIVHSAHEFKTSERHFYRVEEAIRRSPELFAQIKRSPRGRVIGFRYSHGDEAIDLADGRSIEFRTRTRSGMRGFEDVSLLVLDEAMIISDWAHGAMMPTVRASKAERGPQLWYAGSAVDQEVHEHGIVWARIRERGIAGDENLAYFEWSLDFDHPDRIPEAVLSDPRNWKLVNFAMEHGRVREEHMQRELASMPRRAFCVELLGVGDWPSTSGVAEIVIDLDRWAACEDGNSKVEGAVSFAFDVAPDRSVASIAVSGRRSDDIPHIEVTDRKRGTRWVVPRLLELYERHNPEAVVCDASGPASSLITALEDAGVEVTAVNANEHAIACALLYDAVEEENLRHLGTSELASALKGASQRPLGERWAWSRRNSTVDISPLVAVTLAHWATVTIATGSPVLIAAV